MGMKTKITQKVLNHFINIEVGKMSQGLPGSAYKEVKYMIHYYQSNVHSIPNISC